MRLIYLQTSHILHHLLKPPIYSSSEVEGAVYVVALGGGVYSEREGYLGYFPQKEGKIGGNRGVELWM